MIRLIVSLAAFCLIELLTLLLLIPEYYRSNRLSPRSVKALFFKGFPTFLAVLLAALGGCMDPDPFTKLVLCALILGTLADVLINLSLLLGGTFFALGHLCYFCAFIQKGGMTGAFWLVFTAAAIPAAVIAFLSRSIVRSIGIRIGITVYGILLCALLGAAVPQAFVKPGMRTILTAIGVSAFVLSDLLLLRRSVKKDTRFKSCYISLGVYYTSQLLLAFSACFR